MIAISAIDSFIDELAPYKLTERWDNTGLIIGDNDCLVKSVMLALDVTLPVLLEATEKGVQLIITHHPVIFDPVKHLTSGDIISRVVKSGIAVLSAHTNLDLAEGGISDVLANLLGLTDISPLINHNNLGRIGTLKQPLSPTEFASMVKERINADNVRLCEGNRMVKRVAIISGNGGDETLEAIAKNADGYLTGEVSHQHYVAAVNNGMTLIDGGHFATETVVLPMLLDKLTYTFPTVSFFIASQNKPLYKVY